MREAAIRIGIGVASFLLATGVQVSGIQSTGLAIACWVGAAVIGLGVVVTWQPVQSLAVSGVRTVPKLRPQWPLKIKRTSAEAPKERPKRRNKSVPSVISDNVRWEDHGDHPYDGRFEVGNSPYCPDEECLTPLQIQDSGSGMWRSPHNTDSVNRDTPLHCLSCKNDYVFGEDTKKISNAKNEAIVKLLGRRKVEG